MMPPALGVEKGARALCGARARSWEMQVCRPLLAVRAGTKCRRFFGSGGNVMRRLFLKSLLSASALVFAIAPFAHATNYPGNGATGFGGPVGLGSLDITDSGT